MRVEVLRSWLVHVYTALGVVLAFLAAVETMGPEPDPRWVFLWLALAVVVDATDGPLARRWQVSEHLPGMQGRVIDDIVDYLTYTFIPLLLVWRMEWVPEPAWLFVIPALVVSVIAFGRTRAKLEDEGFFIGFPSYWNVVAFYAGWWAVHYGTLLPGVAILACVVLTVIPVGFLYPNRASQPWRWILTVGAILWAVLLLAVLPWYPDVSAVWLWVSLVYPAFYMGLSVVLWSRLANATTWPSGSRE